MFLNRVIEEDSGVIASRKVYYFIFMLVAGRGFEPPTFGL